jgi:integrase
MGVLKLIEGKHIDSYIFDLKRVNTNLSHGPSKWFGRYKSFLGFPSGSKVFHSFRHTFRDKLTFAGISSEYVSEMLGHEHHGETFGRYGSAIPVTILSEQLNKVSFENIFS